MAVLWHLQPHPECSKIQINSLFTSRATSRRTTHPLDSQQHRINQTASQFLRRPNCGYADVERGGLRALRIRPVRGVRMYRVDRVHRQSGANSLHEVTPALRYTRRTRCSPSARSMTAGSALAIHPPQTHHGFIQQGALLTFPLHCQCPSI
ncbi:hypothetical protein BS50DRAFT_104231 [Corynespora cassiicola Philippines]|uniref:Uncharacterized protein n=1 Tax=Corynespora cassiicola Philippines TaxID=1448308 RepID=A0A2T2NCI0_CORCC|nr:hypothetical protein BS50DRAFT_104231 [Corynespora cassiicola Philippines]